MGFEQFVFERAEISSNAQAGEITNWINMGKIWGQVLSDQDRWVHRVDVGRRDQVKILLRDAVGSGIEVGWRLRNGNLSYLITDFAREGRADAVVATRKEGSDAL